MYTRRFYSGRDWEEILYGTGPTCSVSSLNAMSSTENLRMFRADGRPYLNGTHTFDVNSSVQSELHRVSRGVYSSLSASGPIRLAPLYPSAKCGSWMIQCGSR